ncbi:MAG: ERF family protein [Clostridia bacterium]|nr:ERF family protein [Clostridia bacterium]
MTLNEKLSAIQAEIKAPKSRWNDFSGFHYRSYEDIVESAKPVCKEYKTVFFLSEEVVQIGDRYYFKATAVLRDLEKSTDGIDQIIVTAFAREALSKTKFDEAQVSGATSAYAKKMALADLFALDSEDDPDAGDNGKDSAGASQRLTTPRKADKQNDTAHTQKTAPRAPQNATDGNTDTEDERIAQIKAKIKAAAMRTGKANKAIFALVTAKGYDVHAEKDFKAILEFVDSIQPEGDNPF